MIELTQTGGQAVFLNPAHVVAVVPGPGKTANITMLDGTVATVLDSVLTVVNMIDGISA